MCINELCNTIITICTKCLESVEVNYKLTNSIIFAVFLCMIIKVFDVIIMSDDVDVYHK